MDQINILKILFDMAVLLVLFLLFVYSKYFVEPFQSGFYCNDYSVNMPYKKSTVTNTVLMIISIAVPLVFIVFTEVVRTFYMKYKNATLHLRNAYRILLTSRKSFELPEQIGNVFINYGFYVFGLLCNTVLTNLGKKTIGRLRPNFLDICQPAINPFKTLCVTSQSGTTYLRPEIDFVCSAMDKTSIKESRLSFPSGHSSTCFYTAIFLILFIDKTWVKRSLGLVPQFCQFLLFAFATFTALSRVIDNKHHPTDVLAGSLLGTLVALFTFYYLKQFYKRFNYKVKYNFTVRQVDSETNGSQQLRDVESNNNNKKCCGVKTV